MIGFCIEGATTCWGVGRELVFPPALGLSRGVREVAVAGTGLSRGRGVPVEGTDLSEVALVEAGTGLTTQVELQCLLKHATDLYTDVLSLFCLGLTS